MRKRIATKILRKFIVCDYRGNTIRAALLAITKWKHWDAVHEPAVSTLATAPKWTRSAVKEFRNMSRDTRRQTVTSRRIVAQLLTIVLVAMILVGCASAPRPRVVLQVEHEVAGVEFRAGAEL